MTDAPSCVCIARYETGRRHKKGVIEIYCDGKRSRRKFTPYDGAPFEVSERAASPKDRRLYEAAVRSLGHYRI